MQAMDHTVSSPSTTDRLPVLFVSHGSPMFALEAGETGPALTRWGQALRQRHPGLRGVVILSPHWMAHGVEVMAHAQPPTWHDFGGFPPALYRLQYPAPGAPVLAQRVQARLAQAGIAATLNPERPLDHGAWVPLMHLLPQADVPVVQLALPVDADARAVYALGQALQDLRSQGVLLVGSGSMTHNLREFFGGERQAASYVVEFSRWVEQQVQAGAIDALLDWQQQAPHALRAHPTDEHFLPLYFALGAGAGSTPHYLSREVMYGMLAMDAFALQDE
ncbi:LigB family dioxygenase [Comamonas aquatica]|jgi:4,5-DOPA dioxygenase extradiol|uniref:LigB family dioxygenase n=2 Tax=Comamonas aquatica TaxID=225991 RepID=A0AA35DAX2_9BURK|nr:LigB family dioxygenase [Comamonas aquatica]CAB5708050.1 LigB family dioxygenase [Comamonas aquatica]CAC9207321.1 LigB family dioxygenase [Comamonas aquatica]CAC9687270.1 LigB family dioxygenase [Comamonas aquatica]